MAAPTYSLPALGSDTSVSDPLIRTALSDLKTLLTDGINDDNIATGGIGTSSLATNAVTATKITDGNVTTAKIVDDNVTAAKIADGAIDAAAKIGAGVVTDAKLASPNNSVYKTILTEEGMLPADTSAQTNLVRTGLWVVSGSNFGGGAAPPAIIYFDDADYSVGSLTTKLRLRAQVAVNGTAWSSVTATFGLYPVTFSGSADALNITLGTVVAGSTVAHANPGANGQAQGNSGDFTIPSDGPFVIGCVTSAQQTNNSVALLSAQLQTRNV